MVGSGATEEEAPPWPPCRRTGDQNWELGDDGHAASCSCCMPAARVTTCACELLSPFLKYIRCRFHTRFLGKLAHDLALGNRIQPLLRFADESGMRWIPASFRHTKL
ncbi:hypothetical protein CBR_g4220 [Chara braunii]|uniref:Uncharacterized protein n=1 Tax=Chara braunii TaxID=69332 RepID=A0A388JR65_CHABU|nr:hypothetical protein CBR_g4220 [Chara braunii]|eukprot:GBG60267.1 hypothetical protein CBR_g4220 [Chara braunii]